MSPERGHAFCVNLHSRNECQDFARATLYGNFRKNAAPQNTDTHFARACAVETQVKTWQGPLYAEIYRKKAAPKSENPDQAPAFTAPIRTLQGANIRPNKNNNKNKNIKKISQQETPDSLGEWEGNV